MNFKFLIEIPRCQELRGRVRLCNTKIQLVFVIQKSSFCEINVKMGAIGKSFTDLGLFDLLRSIFVEDMNFKFLIEMPRCQEPRESARLCNTKIR